MNCSDAPTVAGLCNSTKVGARKPLRIGELYMPPISTPLKFPRKMKLTTPAKAELCVAPADGAEIVVKVFLDDRGHWQRIFGSNALMREPVIPTRGVACCLHSCHLAHQSRTDGLPENIRRIDRANSVFVIIFSLL